MTMKRTINTELGSIRIYEKSFLVHGVAKPFFLGHGYSTDQLPEEFFLNLAKLIEVTFNGGRQHESEKRSQSLKSLLKTSPL